MRIIRKYSIPFFYLKFVLQLWNSVMETEARSLNNMHTNFRRPLRNGFMYLDVLDAVHTQTDNTYKTAGSNSSLPVPLMNSDTDTNQRHMPYVVPQSFQDYLSTVIEAELKHKGRGIPSHSRQRRSKIKLIIKKILLFLKLFTKYFFFVAKKTAIIVG